MADGVDEFNRAVLLKDSKFHFIIRRFSDRSVDCSLPLGSILRMNALQTFFPTRRAIFWVEAINAIPFVGQMQRVPSRNLPDPTPRMRNPLCLCQITFAPAQRFLRTLALTTRCLKNLVRGLELL